MFEIIRQRSKFLMFVLVLLIIPSFVLLGVGDNTSLSQKGQTVATVDGQDILQNEWDAAHNLEIQRLRGSNPALDLKLLDSPELRYATLERMVRERVLAAAAQKAALITSDQRLARDLQQNPTIASLRRADGTLDMERYKQLVGSQGMTPEMFEARVRNDLSIQQVVQGVAASGFTPAAVSNRALSAFFERRDVRMARFNTADYLPQVVLTEADLAQHYKDNAAQYQAPEQASIEYLVLDLNTVKSSLVLNEQDVKTYYEQNATRLAAGEERRASHILLNAGKDAPAAERQKAKDKAEELLAVLRKTPDQFAALAKQNSQDPGSAASGGDLDFFTRGAMVKPFEDAAFAMKKGEISAVVESDFGYHIIQLTDIKGAKQRSFEELRPEIETTLRNQLATARFAEAAESFTNSVYEQSDSLKPAADKLKLTIQTATGLARQPAPGATGVLANGNFLSALFSADSLERKRNTEAIETGASQLVAGRVVQYTPARTLPLEEVKARVRESAIAQKAAALARAEGMAKLSAWQTNAAAASLPEAVVVSREQAQSLPPALITAVLRADAEQLPAMKGIDLGAAGYVVVRVDKVLPRAAADATRTKSDQSQYASWWTSAETLAYYNVLKDRFKAQIKVSPPPQ